MPSPTAAQFRSGLTLERLETRDNPAVSIVLNTSQNLRGLLTVTGDGLANAVTLRESAGLVVVTAVTAGVTTTRQFPATSVTEARVLLAAGNDILNGTTFSKTITAFGGTGNDTLNGGNGADNLYGEAGIDTLRGNGGNDGLFGGNDTDSLFGGVGSDRLLQFQGQAEVKDGAAPDAIITFRNGTKAWTQAEVQKVDVGLLYLHRRTGNDNLLERPEGTRLTFIRDTVDPDPGFANDTFAANFNDGTISVYDLTFTSNEVTTTIIHEVGHNWDDPEECGAATFQGWLALSGWVDDGTGNFTAGANAQFTNEYAQSSPFEDWSSSWERAFVERFGLGANPFAGVVIGPNNQTLDPIPAKVAFLERFFETVKAL